MTGYGNRYEFTHGVKIQVWRSRRRRAGAWPFS